MSVCPDCGFPFDGINHPDRNCGAGPRDPLTANLPSKDGPGTFAHHKRRIANDDFQIDSDGVTVWVNHSQGWCIGRFGFMGVDIHNEPDSQEGATQCLQCTHGPTTVADWTDFQYGMLTHYGIQVGDEHRPKRFQ